MLLAKPQPVDLRCSDQCFRACEFPGAISVREDGTADPRDVEQLALVLTERLLDCDISRWTCERCIERGRTLGVIR